MQRGVNKVVIVGHCGQDPESRSTGSGDIVTRISVATSEVWKDKNSGANQERTEWHSIVFFGKLAVIVSDYLRKGAQVYIEGRLHTSKWDDNHGVARQKTEIIASEMQMLGKKKEATNTPVAPLEPNPPADSFNDDIPF